LIVGESESGRIRIITDGVVRTLLELPCGSCQSFNFILLGSDIVFRGNRNIYVASLITGEYKCIYKGEEIQNMLYYDDVLYFVDAGWLNRGVSCFLESGGYIPIDFIGVERGESMLIVNNELYSFIDQNLISM
jgi:hypothetical protein